MKKIFLLLLICGFVPCVFSIPLENLVSNHIAGQLRSNDSVIIEYQSGRNRSPLLIPDNNDLRHAVSLIIGEVNRPDMMIEAVYLYKKPARAYTSSAAWDNNQKIELFNQMLSLSTLTGLEYYSASRGEMRTFFEYSSVVDGSNIRTALPISDPVLNNPPAQYNLYARQRDLTFGDNMYRYDYVYAKDYIYFVQQNLTNLTIAGIRIIGANNQRSVMTVFDCGDSLLIYSITIANTIIGANLVEQRINNSFSNRAEALLKWFAGRADIVFSR